MFKRILIAVTALSFAACASQPETQLEESVSDDSTSETSGELTQEKIMAAQAAGYTIVDEDGKQLLCRRDQQTGSRVRYKTSCLTAHEWERLAESSRKTVEDMARRRPPRQGT